jgi:hypothetical protein
MATASVDMPCCAWPRSPSVTTGRVLHSVTGSWLLPAYPTATRTEEIEYLQVRWTDSEAALAPYTVSEPIKP